MTKIDHEKMNRKERVWKYPRITIYDLVDEPNEKPGKSKKDEIISVQRIYMSLNIGVDFEQLAKDFSEYVWNPENFSNVIKLKEWRSENYKLKQKIRDFNFELPEYVRSAMILRVLLDRAIRRKKISEEDGQSWIQKILLPTEVAMADHDKVMKYYEAINVINTKAREKARLDERQALLNRIRGIR